MKSGLHVDHAELLADKLAARLQRAYFPLTERALLTQTETGGEWRAVHESAASGLHYFDEESF